MSDLYAGAFIIIFAGIVAVLATIFDKEPEDME